MVREFIVSSDRYYQDVKGKMHVPGSRVMLEDTLPHNISQMFKLTPIETTYEYTLPKIEDVIKQADEVIRKHKAEMPVVTEPPKVIVDPNKKKPAQDIPKAKATTMLERVENFVKEQEEKNKK